MNRIKWEYYDKYDEITKKYLPATGEGETLATQLVTSITKLIYKWYNDGDIYDNTKYLSGWCNDLSSYANWLEKHIDGAKDILDKVFDAKSDDDYEYILKELADNFLDEVFLETLNKFKKEDTIYQCEGSYKFIEIG